MADKDNNMPKQDPETQENEIKDLQPGLESENPIEESAATDFDQELPTESGNDAPEVVEDTVEDEIGEVINEGVDLVPTEDKSVEVDEDNEPHPEDDADVDLDDESDDTDERFEINIGPNGEISLDGSSGWSRGNGVNDDDADDEDDDDEDENDDTFDPFEFIDPEDLIIHDEVVDAIKAEGEKLKISDPNLKVYLKHSKEAVKSFESALKIGQRAMESNRDDREVPVILAGIMKICGKILEIKCNNLENIVRIKAHEYIKEARTALHLEIDRYNDYVITYASITGEQLTRLSTLLPESIASGKSLAVVPVLSYKESYVSLDPDAEKTADEKVTTTVITPLINADNLICDIRVPSGKGGCRAYARRMKRATKKIQKECTKLNKLISETKSLRTRYENELLALEKRTPIVDRATKEYKDKVFEINIKYGQLLSGIQTVKTQNAFARTRVRQAVDRFAFEREKLVIAYEYLRNVYRVGNYSQRKMAEKFFVDATLSYNKCAELCSKATGTAFDKIPLTMVELACRGKEEIEFPVIAYKRELVETVGTESRFISMVVKEDILPNEEAYADSREKILEKHGTLKNTSVLSDESAMEDRASAIAKIIIDSLKESADMVVTADEFEQFKIRSDKALKYFKKSLRATEKAISKAFDENGVVTALVENLRVIANIIEVRRINISVAMRIKRTDVARSNSKALYKNIELYNGRAIDYTSIVGEQFSRITTATSKELMNSAENIKVPIITYKDNYIEVFPKDPLKDSTFEKPKLWRAGVYTPLLMHHFRLTENRAVETTVINSPFVFDVMTDEMPATSWWHPIGFWQHLFVWAQPIVAWWHRISTNIEIWFVDESLIFSKSGLRGRQRRNERKKTRYERKIKRLNDEHNKKILDLETIVHESDRQSESYQKKIYKINTKFNRKIYRLKMRWMRECPGRNEARLLLERLVLERERLAGINKVLIKYRNYGRITFTRNILGKYKRRFVEAISAHNATAKKLAEIVGVKFAEVSTSVADEIIRNGKMIKFPEIVCCREVIETVDGHNRTVGDRWHGYGLYTGTSGSEAGKANAPIMSVGAMGYATDMGVPFLKADFDGMSIMGMTPGGVPLIGFNQTGETSIPFTGTPMMLAGSDVSVILDAGRYDQDSMILGAADVNDPYSGIHKRGVDARYTDDIEDDAKDLHSGCEVETPLDLETKMIEERFTRALRARSMTSVDNVKNWWKLVGSEINVWFMRRLTLRPQGFLRVFLPPMDDFVEIINLKVSKKDVETLQHIARVGGIIDIECKRLYSAVKTGVRRSQRVWSGWLHSDIDVYNELVKKYNEGKPRHMHLEMLSLTMPDTIIHRREDRPPAPPVLSLRNRVKLDTEVLPIGTDEIYDKLVEYARNGVLKYRGFFGRAWAKMVTIPRLNFHYRLGHEGIVLSIVGRVIRKRTARTYFRRQENENRHYRIRFEKARAMRRYNRRTLRAIGLANDPIKYQSKVHNVLRKYLSANFRIDYNMRIRQLIYRALRVNTWFYLVVVCALAVVIGIAALVMPSHPALEVLTIIGLAWAALPIILFLLRIVYDIVMFLASIILVITRNIWLIRYGARDVERNRYGAILDCFVTEQYGLLLACEKLRRKPKSSAAKKVLIATVNDYNKRTRIYSEILRVPIREVETTALIEKLTVDHTCHLSEIQNFVYVRELVERTDHHLRGKTMNEREIGILVEEINQVINSINLTGSEESPAIDFLQSAMQRFIGFIQTDIKPTQNERYELKRDLIQGIEQVGVGPERREIFSRNVIKVVDQLGGRDKRRIISVLAEDNMIL